MADSMTLRDCTPRPHLVVIAVTVTADDCLGPDQFGRPSCFRVAASSRHASPHAASRSLMWSSARFRRSANVLGLSSVDIQKSLKNCRTISRRRSISCLLGEASDVMPIWWLSGRTATLSAIALLPPETRSFRLRRPVRLQYSWSGRCCSAARCSGRARRRQPIQSHKLRQSQFAREASARCIMTRIA